MAQKKRTKKKRKTTKKQKQLQEQRLVIIIGLIFILFAVFSLFSLGFLGNLIANVLRMIGGNTYQFLAFLLGVYGLLLVVKNTKLKFSKGRRWAGIGVFYIGILVILHARLFANVQSQNPNVLKTTWELLMIDFLGNQVTQNVGGGMLGGAIYSLTHFLVSQVGSYIIAGLLLVLGVYLFSMLDFAQVTDFLNHSMDTLQQKLTESDEKKAERTAKREERQAARAKQKAEKEAAAKERQAEKERNQVRPLTPGEKLAKENLEPLENEPEQMTLVPIEAYQANAEPKKPMPDPIEEIDEEADAGDLEFEISAEPEDHDYQLPPSSLLDSIPAADQSDEYKKIENNIKILEKTFDSFGVEAKVVKASLGPSVTKFEIQPAVGVKVSKIVNLTDDIALALAAKDVRMEAPIPGKSLIGIEVPNSTISTVSFRDIIESQPNHPDKLLEVPLGRDISGMVRTADLTKMPHLLIAGSTGSGKSVAINGIITSILMRAKPNEVKMMMIDPKMVELNVYNGIPHLLTPVVTNPRKASQALHKVVQEMEERYEKFAATGVRNITGFNELVIQKNLEDGQNRPILPFIVVIVDELADLMMVASNEVEDAITRLAQMARAAGIHMILATQRPSVDVITGIIKANVPSRIAFAVSSGTDSRTIIDSNGAEKLLGRGDMLFLPMGENKPIRVQGAFISDHEVEEIVTFVSDQQEAHYEEKMMPTEETTSSPSEVPQDDLYEEAKALVVEMQTASISLLQRRFRIGYNRAARIVDELEENKVIGPSVGSKPREVYLQKTEEEPEETTEY
ncbi:DNA translocase FtsK [Enterococcus pallens]|uniref:DNA translocase FtsK n=1 Tax=Enterococcus pallens ATCC BAA-351 TaxID=1158607 RepID=R2PXP1_9ENTE|nr:DNA translocase FtsK [Enterococcus pallens]EOH87943.1 cell division protein FtsK [Enterococcus pallens ATCC BAA-351]EOU18157.1 cell division protein FtsK [Enterococcus pallens ATCC BAA-351]OJG82222.1 cell division protein FtsK [Enterococcus pallens]